MTKRVLLRFSLSEVELLIGSNTPFPRVHIVICPRQTRGRENRLVTEREATKRVSVDPTSFG